MRVPPLEIHEITDINDDLLLPWLDLYERAFPPSEKYLVSTFLAALREAGHPDPRGLHLLAAVNPSGHLTGMAAHQRLPQLGAALLWYMAIAEPERGKGCGTWLYQEILAWLEPPCSAVFLEVEDPEQAETPEARRFAERRIGFYRRLGARRLLGIKYLQYVGDHVSPIPMLLMVHPLKTLDPEQAFNMARAIFGEHITQESTLLLE